MRSDHKSVVPLAPAGRRAAEQPPAAAKHRAEPAVEAVALVETPVEIACQRLGFSVEQKKPAAEKALLSGVSAVFRPGRLTAIMGPSGAGKTTLLNHAAGRLQAGTPSGTVFVNGARTTPAVLRDLVSFVHQEDVMLPTMTVRECIMMSAELRLPASMPRESKVQRVEALLDVLELGSAADTMIGSSITKGVSGGERKRTAIAQEMVTHPSVLFLDEPVSGLDAFMALTVFEILADLAEAGHTVVCTVHQPSSDIFHLCDDLVLLARGQVVYAGAVADVVPFFAGAGFVCPSFTNPADFLFTKVLHDKADVQNGRQLRLRQRTQRQQLQSGRDDALEAGAAHATVALLSTGSVDERIPGLLEWWGKSAQCAAAEGAVEESSLGRGESWAPGAAAKHSHRGRAPFATQMRVLCARAGKNVKRHKMLLRGKIAQTLVFSLIASAVYSDLGRNQASIQNRQGALFFVTMNNILTPALGGLSIFVQERAVFLREHAAGLYSLPAYFLSKVLLELPTFVIAPLVMSAIVYPSLGLQDGADKFFLFAATLVLANNTGGAIGVMTACQWPDVAVAMAVLPLFLLPLMLLGGFFVNSDTIPAWLDWIKYISPVKWGFEVLTDNEFRGLPFECGASELAAGGVCPITRGEEVLQRLGSEDLSNGTRLACMASIYVAALLLAYMGLVRMSKSR